MVTVDEDIAGDVYGLPLLDIDDSNVDVTSVDETAGEV